jgi:uncharacterized protein YndB with AHSA1/START domain
MNQNAQTAIIEINAPIEKVWQLWTSPADIMQWNNLSAEKTLFTAVSTK